MLKKALKAISLLALLASHSFTIPTDLPVKTITDLISDVSALDRDTMIAAGLFVGLVGASAWACYYLNTHAEENITYQTDKLLKKIDDKYKNSTAADLVHAAELHIISSGKPLYTALFNPCQTTDQRIKEYASERIEKDLKKLIKLEKIVQDRIAFHKKKIKKACKDVEQHKQAQTTLEQLVIKLTNAQEKLKLLNTAVQRFNAHS